MKKYFITICLILSITIGTAQNNSIFMGGVGDGNSFSGYSQSYANIKNGGAGDGSNMNTFTQLYTDIRKGGIGDGWAMQSAILPLTPLNVHLLFFIGEQSNNLHILKWKSIDEKNTDWYILEHSVDNLNFTTLSKIAAKGNATGDWTYKFENNIPIIGNNFYRLKLIDKNGSSAYSNIVLLKYADNKSLISVYPNPTASQLNIKVQNTNKICPIEIEVIDINGKIIFYQLMQEFQTSSSIEVSQWARGLYLLSIKEDDDITIFKVMKE